MKRIPLFNFFLPILVLLSLTGCSGEKKPVVPANEAQPANEVTASPATSEPAITAAPTETPPPLACMIAFDSDPGGNLDIYIMGSDGKDPVNLSNNPGDDFDPSWSPDGSRIAFVSNRENGKEGGQFIYVMNADGSDVRQLNTENESAWPDWSHIGDRITYTHQGDIYAIQADGSGESINLTNSPEEDEQSTFSPDGRKIAWLSGNEGNRNVYVMNADGSNRKQITDNGRAGRVEWTVDGQILTDWGWKDRQEFCHTCVVSADGLNIVDGGGKGELNRYRPFWTADGKRVECISVNLNHQDDEIYLVSGSYPDIFLNLTNNPANDRNPDWPANCSPADKTVVDDELPEDPGQIVIGYAGDNDGQTQRKANFQRACEELGIQCISGDIPELIEQSVDAIVQNASPVVVNDLLPSMQKATEKGIPIFLLDAETNSEGIYSITVDRQQWLNTGLEWMIKKIGGTGDLAFFDFQPGSGDTAIIEDTLKKYPEIHVVTQDIEKYNFKDGKPYVYDLMEDFPDIKAIWSNDVPSTIVLGMADTDIPSEKWPLLMCEPTKEGLFIWKDRLTDHPGMQCIAAGNPPGIAYEAAYGAYYLAGGAQMDEAALKGPYGRSLYVDFPVVTNDNLREWLEKVKLEDGRYILDELMTPEEIRKKWFVE